MIRICTDAEAEAADFMLCARLEDDPGTFTDNHLGNCCVCGAVVIFRPYMPKTPKRICLQCMPAVMKPT